MQCGLRDLPFLPQANAQVDNSIISNLALIDTGIISSSSSSRHAPIHGISLGVDVSREPSSILNQRLDMLE